MTTAMNVLLLGGSFDNLGDEFMLSAVAKRLRDYGARLIAPHTTGTYESRAQLGLHQLLWRPKWKSFSGSVGRYVMLRYGAPFGIVSDTDIDLVIDFGGFDLGDAWGKEAAFRKLKHFRRLKANGCTIICLPKAYGPFTGKDFRTIVKNIIDCADLVFVREAASRAHLLECGIDAARLQAAPDLTFPEGLEAVPRVTIGKPYFCVVPNKWMLERVPAKVSAAYLDWLMMLSRRASRNELSAVLLLHSRHLDDDLCAALMGKGNDLFTCVRPETPYEAKALLGRAEFVITSRYHALIAALSQAVPCLGTSWCHKYDQVFDEFGIRRFLFVPEADPGPALEAIDELSQKQKNETLRAPLNRTARECCARVEEMWKTLGTLIADRRPLSLRQG
jgi:colanic acid/amylovoran biosynthesis protein